LQAFFILLILSVYLLSFYYAELSSKNLSVPDQDFMDWDVLPTSSLSYSANAVRV
jgi:hypothetical protein